MKTNFKYLIPAFLCLLPACSQEGTAPDTDDRIQLEPVSVSVTIDQETRATVSESSGSIAFSAGDAIVIHNGNGIYVGVTQDSATSGMFSMEEGFTVTGNGHAGFPANLVSEITASGVTFSLPDTYDFEVVGGPEANSANVPCPMVGTLSGNGSIVLKPVTAIVRFYITNVKAGTLIFSFPTNVTGNSGVITATSGSNDGITSLSNGGKTITVTDVPKVPNGKYVVITLPVPAGTVPRDIQITNAPEDGSLSRVADIAGSNSALARAVGHKIMGFSFVETEAVQVLSGVTVSPAPVTLWTAGSQMLTATALDADAKPIADASITWSVVSGNSATVSSNGIVTASASTAGATTIRATASFGGLTRTADCLVTVKKLGSVILSSSENFYVNVGANAPALTVTALDNDGETIPLNSDGLSVEWSSSDEDVASVTNGIVTGATPGTSVISATVTYKGVEVTSTDNPTVTVLAVPASIQLSANAATLWTGETLQLTGAVKDAAGNAISGVTISWLVKEGNSATVSSSGLITASSSVAGTTTVQAAATYNGSTVTGECVITVKKLASVELSFTSNFSINVGTNASALTAVAKDNTGATIEGANVEWYSSNTSVATVSGGIVHGVSSGTATISATATYKGVEVTSTNNPMVTVNAVLASVSLSASSATLWTQETKQLTATAKDASGHEISGVSVTWSNASGTSATVNGSGLVTASTTIGASTIRATVTHGGVTATADCIITVKGIASCTLSSSSNISLTVGDTYSTTLTVTSATDSDGNDIPLNSSGLTHKVVSSNTSVATVTSGVVKGVSAGTATISGSVTYKGVTVSSTNNPTVTVKAAPYLNSVSVSDAVVAPNGTVTLTATAKDQNGKKLSGATVTWSRTSGSTASIASNTGVVTATGTEGDNVFKATVKYGGKTKTAECTVKVRELSVLTLSTEEYVNFQHISFSCNSNGGIPTYNYQKPTAGDPTTIIIYGRAYSSDGISLNADSMRWTISDTSVCTGYASGDLLLLSKRGTGTTRITGTLTWGSVTKTAAFDLVIGPEDL